MRGALLLFLIVAACARPAARDPASPAPERASARPAPPAPSGADDSVGTAGVTARPRDSTAAPGPVDPLATEAANVVDRQNAAYNRQDIEAFLATYADSIAVHTLGDTTVLTGKARLRETTAAWFAEAPAARTEVVERMVQGPFVVDRQRVSGAEGSPPLDAIGIYEVREGLIRRVWTIPPPPTPH